jgi:hypothetical protein
MSLIRRAVGLAFVIITAPSTTQAQPIPADKGNELPRVVRLTAPGPVYREWPVYRVWFVADGERVLGLTARGWVTWPTSGGPATTLVDDALLYAHDNERREWYSDVSADGRVAVDVVCEPVTGTTRRIPLNTSPWLVRLSPDGRRISTPLAGKETVVWDTVTGAVVDRRPEPPYAEARLLVRQPASDGPGLRWSVTAVPNPRPPTIGDNVATPEHIATHLTDHRTGRRIELAPSPWYTEGHCGQLTRDDTRFVLRCDYGGQPAGSVAVWDTRTGERLMRWDSPKLWRESVAVSADGRSLLACHDRDLSAVEIASGQVRFSIRHRDQVMSAAFHPSGLKAVVRTAREVYICDLPGASGRWGPAQAEAAWDALASEDAPPAGRAIRTLQAHPAEAVALLSDRVKLPVPAEATVAKWIRALDATAYRDRERSQAELTAVADLVRPQLEAARKSASAEADRRLVQIIESIDRPTPDRLRQVRACEILEAVRTPEAMRLLRTWAGGPPAARRTREAADSLGRLYP